MKFALLVAGLLAGWAASAGADLPPVPTVPTLPVAPTLPALPPPPRATQPPPASLPKAPTLPRVSKPRVSKPVLPIGGGSVTGGGGGAASSNGTSAGASSQSQGPARHTGSRPAKVYRLHFSRNWISRTGPKQGKKTVLVFVLRRASLVEFVVFELAPDCRRIGRFQVAGRPGVNHVRFRGHIGRGVLGPGTYRITARTLPRGRALVDTKLVVVARPEREEITSARGANACGSKAQGQSTSSAASTPAKPSAAAPPAAGDKAEKRAQPSRDHGVLGATFTKRAVDAVRSIPLWLFVLLGLAIAILAVAALPLRATPTRRGASALAHHRGIVALAGAAVLLAVTLAYTLH